MPFLQARAGVSGVQDLGDLAVRAAIPTAQSFRRMKSSPIASRQRRVLLPTQVAERVRTDARVALLERTNLRYLEPGQVPGGAPVDLVTLDLSFISVLKVLPAVCGLLAPRGALLVLIKPQFEAGREQVRRLGTQGAGVKVGRRAAGGDQAGFKVPGSEASKRRLGVWQAGHKRGRQFVR